MKLKFLLVTLLALPLTAKEYYAKVEPYELLQIASNVNAQIIKVDEAQEGRVLGSKAFIVMDDTLDKAELRSTRSKIATLEAIAQKNETLLQNYKEMLAKKEKNYARIKDLSIKSDSEKDREFYDLIATRNQYIATIKENDNLKINLNDAKIRLLQLEKNIKNKHISAPGYVLYKLMVKKAQVVAMGTVLAQVADISKAKLTLYLSAKDHDTVSQKVIYLNGEKTDYKITQLWDIADEKQLSNYKAQIIIKAPKTFSKLVKVSFRDE